MTDLTTFTPHRILVLQQRQIGDVLLTTPAMAALRHRYPDAEIHFLTEKKCADMLLGNPDINRLILLDKSAAKGIHAFAWYWSVARNGYDLVIDFQSLPRLKWITLFSGATVRLAATTKRRSRLIYNAFPDSITPGYAAWDKVNLLSTLGVKPEYTPPRLYLTDQEIQNAKAFLQSLGRKDNAPFISVDVTHRRLTCKWPASAFAEALELIHIAHPELKFFVFWGPGEQNQAMEMVNALHPETRDAVWLIPEVQSMRMIAACIQQASVHFGNCSAPQHMAVAVGTPTCIVTGCTGPTWRCPAPENIDVSAGLSCQYCQHNSCDRGIACLTSLSPQKVAQQVLTFLCK